MADARSASNPATVLGMDVVLPPGAFRLILAVAVVVSHLSNLAVGRLAVLIFFLLSGYWTAKIWQDKFKSSNTLMFYVSRIWRIYPLFLIVTILSALARNYDLSVANFTLLGLGSAHNDPTGVSWSLDIELQFYLLLPLIFGAVAARPLVVMLVACLLSAVGWWLHVYLDILTVMKFLPAFLVGAIVCKLNWTASRRMAHASLIAFVVFTAITATTPFFWHTKPDPFDVDAWSFLWMLFLIPYVANSLAVRSSKLDRHLGNLSYPLYLVHFPIIAIIASAMETGMAAKLAALGASAILALLLYIAVDRPIDRMRVAVTERRL